MIFVPLNNGMIQAFNAKTLDSLWLYTDTVGGSCLSALRYDSGYVYGSFVNGNLVCISAADEDPKKTTEAKNAVWRTYDSGGFSYTGVYTGETNLYACGGSGYVYCLNKKTGSVVQKFLLPEEAGNGCTAVCYSDGRIYFGTSKGYLYSYPIQKDGKLRLDGEARLKVGGTVYGTPLVYKNRIYLGTASDRYGTSQGRIILRWRRSHRRESFPWPIRWKSPASRGERRPCPRPTRRGTAICMSM